MNIELKTPKALSSIKIELLPEEAKSLKLFIGMVSVIEVRKLTGLDEEQARKFQLNIIEPLYEFLDEEGY